MSGCGETSRNPFSGNLQGSARPAYIPHILITVRKSKQKLNNSHHPQPSIINVRHIIHPTTIPVAPWHKKFRMAISRKPKRATYRRSVGYKLQFEKRQKRFWLLILNCDQKIKRSSTHVCFKSWSVEASADVSLFKYNWDPSLIPVTVPAQKHNLTSMFLIFSQIHEHLHLSRALSENVKHCCWFSNWCESVDLFRHYSDFWKSRNVFLCHPCFKLAVSVFCQTSSGTVVIGRIGPLFPRRLNLSPNLDKRTSRGWQINFFHIFSPPANLEKRGSWEWQMQWGRVCHLRGYASQPLSGWLGGELD